MNVWISKQQNGSYLMTRFKPILERVTGTHHADLYVRPGDPLGVRSLCPEGVAGLIGPETEQKIETFGSVYVNLSAEIVNEPLPHHQR